MLWVSVKIRDQPVAMFNATFNVFYIFVHLYYHFLQVEVGLQICDWMLWQKYEEDAIDQERLYGYVKAGGARRAWKTFSELAVEHLGLRLSETLDWKANYSMQDVSFLLENVLTVGNFGKYGDSM